MPGTVEFHEDTSLPRRPAMVRQKTRDAFMAKTSVKAKMLAEDKTSSTSLEVGVVHLLETGIVTSTARIHWHCRRRWPEQLD